MSVFRFWQRQDANPHPCHCNADMLPLFYFDPQTVRRGSNLAQLYRVEGKPSSVSGILLVTLDPQKSEKSLIIPNPLSLHNIFKLSHLTSSELTHSNVHSNKWFSSPYQQLSPGALYGGPQCRMSILRNGNVACPCRLFYPMSHVKFKNRLCRHVTMIFSPCRMSRSPMSHVKLKKCPCRHVDFRGQGP